MPLVRIAVQEGQHTSRLAKIGDAVHRAMVETINVPPLDRFQIITEHPQSGFIFDPSYLNISRTNALIMIQIALSAGRSTELKKGLYKRIAELLHQEVNVRKEDVFITLIEVVKENWSFGNGEAQYAT
jgi:phenylpyruvate tautomerase PptA (4-oxalocrotonate tautomerase family)